MDGRAGSMGNAAQNCSRWIHINTVGIPVKLVPALAEQGPEAHTVNKFGKIHWKPATTGMTDRCMSIYCYRFTMTLKLSVAASPDIDAIVSF